MGKPLRGIVVDNNDPKRLGRIKCEVPPFIMGSASELPWIMQRASTGLGGTGSDSGMCIPLIGSQVVVEFPWGDPYSAVYSGFWRSDATDQSTFAEDYPNTYGFEDNTGTYWKVNMAQRYTEFKHTSGSYLRFKADGTVEEHVAKDKITTIAGNKTETVDGDTVIHIKGKKTEGVDGDVEHTYSSSVTETHVGASTLNIPSARTINGDVTENGNLSVNGNIGSSGSVAAQGDVSDGVRSMAKDRAIYDSHIHPHGIPTTGVPLMKQGSGGSGIGG